MRKRKHRENLSLVERTVPTSNVPAPVVALYSVSDVFVSSLGFVYHSVRGGGHSNLQSIA